MKKIIIASLVLLSWLPATAQTKWLGDVNGNQQLDMMDMTIMIDILNGNRSMPADIRLYDLNEDKKFTKDDVLLLAKMILGIEPKKLAASENTDYTPVGGTGKFD